MPHSVLIFGERLFSAGHEHFRHSGLDTSHQVSIFEKPTVPQSGILDGTAYVDLDNEEFRAPAFLSQLSISSDKLRVVGISDTIEEHDILEVAKLGISDILTFKDYRAHLARQLQPEKGVPAPKTDFGKGFDLSAIIGKSPSMIAIKQLIADLSGVDYPNAITFGETGTGKDLVAKVMHYTGIRKAHHFIEVNCSTIPDQLFESEMFGHTKGAFTDAKAHKLGLFEFADGGTIFLDEIGNLSMCAQAKLLKVLETRKLRPLGAVEENDINVRVHASTNIDLQEAVRLGRFREDLLFRLNLIAIHLSPLRDRKEDIPEIAGCAFEFYRLLYNKPNLDISEDVIPRLLEHDWPGNVRELRNVIERTILLNVSKKITADCIDESIRSGRLAGSERRQITIDIPKDGLTLRQIEQQILAKILNISDGNRSEAARILGISRGRLRRILENSTDGPSGERAMVQNEPPFKLP